jgi:5'-3' exonuclease
MFLASKNKLYTKYDLEDEYGITPEQWKKVKEIAGCKGDAVPGIPGVGYPTAAKFLTGELVKGKVYDRIVSPDFDNVKKLAKKLTWLPIAKTPKIKFVDDQYDLNFDVFLELCTTMSFNSFISNGENFNCWKRFFEGNYGKS